jgi:Cdc6-like AAA superfamily ATPase
MLAGRWAQLTDIVSAIASDGQHVGLYGERGVGKTSLANVLSELLTEIAGDRDAVPLGAVKLNCSTNDDFESLWRGIFRRMKIEVDDEDPQTYSPEGIRSTLEELQNPTIIVLDELDRLEDDDALTALADTIKTLSDHAVPSTIVLVGVARSISDLVGEHASIVRALAQIKMPRMSRPELTEILKKGCDRAGLTVTADAADEIVTLSEGLPHYTHLLALHSGNRAVQEDRSEITLADVRTSIPTAVSRHTIVDAYQQATRSARKDALFAQVLLACALAPKNELGYFTSGSIREPLEVIAGRRIEIPAFSNHLSQFLEPERGAVLQREGSPRKYFYRFADPIFQPYVVLHGLSTEMITDEQRRKFQVALTPPDLGTDSFENPPPQLF